MLAKFESNLDQFSVAVKRSAKQFENGYDLAAAQTGTMSRAQGQANSVKMSSLITGAVWLVSIGNVDMKDDVQRWAEDGAKGMIGVNRGATDRQTSGAEDLAYAFEHARKEGGPDHRRGRGAEIQADAVRRAGLGIRGARGGGGPTG